jgi:hypothetical protein
MWLQLKSLKQSLKFISHRKSPFRNALFYSVENLTNIQHNVLRGLKIWCPQGRGGSSPLSGTRSDGSPRRAVRSSRLYGRSLCSGDPLGSRLIGTIEFRSSSVRLTAANCSSRRKRRHSAGSLSRYPAAHRALAGRNSGRKCRGAAACGNSP